MKRTKIVCTIGPASNTEAVIEKLIRAGMNVARLNFSHGTHEEHGEVIRTIRSVSERLGTPVAILQDIAGPKIRIGVIENGPVTLAPGDLFVLTSREVPGNEREVSVNFRNCRLLCRWVIRFCWPMACSNCRWKKPVPRISSAA